MNCGIAGFAGMAIAKSVANGRARAGRARQARGMSMDDDARAPGGADEPRGGEPPRLGNPTRITPRRSPPQEPEPAGHDAGSEPPTGEPLSRGPVGQPGGTGASRRALPESLGPMFAPRSLGGGRVQLFGCSPGCLVASLIASVLATLLLNALF